MSVQELDSEGRPLLERNAKVASQLLASAITFFFLAFVFGYFYLRSLNNDHLWRPKGIDAPVGLGTVFFGLIVLSAVAVYLSTRGESRRALLLGVGLVLGAAALVVQVVEWARLGFGPTGGGYASVFVGWTGFYFLFALIGLLFVEVQFANAVRKGGSSDGLASTSFFWSFLAGIGVVTWLVLFLV
jgi:heme/copper-type cytochrome/quinol oxidase subunit 3